MYYDQTANQQTTVFSTKIAFGHIHPNNNNNNDKNNVSDNDCNNEDENCSAL